MFDAANLRALLFVPGHDTRKLQRAMRSGADAVVLDLEDSVPPDAKEAARNACAEFLSECAALPVRWLRINSPRSPWFAQDLEFCRSTHPELSLCPNVNLRLMS